MSVMDGEDVEHGSQQHHDRDENHDDADDPVDDDDAALVEDGPDFVDEPCESEPPQYGSSDDAGIAYEHHQWPSRYDESELCETGHEEEDNQWVGQRDEKGRDAVVNIGALGQSAVVHVASGVGAVAENAESE